MQGSVGGENEVSDCTREEDIAEWRQDGKPDMIQTLKLLRLRWAGHLVKIEQNSI